MKYRKKPVVIEAIQWKGQNFNEILTLSKKDGMDLNIEVFEDFITIYTLEGEHRCSLNDWVIQGVQGELYPCKPDIFEATYERVEE